MKIVIAEPISDALNKRIADSKKPWVVYGNRPTSTQELIERLKDAEGASSYSVRFSREVLEASPTLKYVAIPAVGASFFIDMEAAKELGVTVMNCPGYNSQAVAELAVGLMLDVYRHLSAETAKLRDGSWSLELPVGRQLSGKTVGLIGYGNVGKKIEQLLCGWDVKVIHVNSSSSDERVDELVSSSDIVVVCCPITEQTRDLVDARRIGLMRETAIVVNVGRGGVVNESALYDALKEGRISGAGLDVFEHEPEQVEDDMTMVQRFASLPNVVCTPHLAGTTEEAREVLGGMIYESLESCEDGSPVNVYLG